MYIPITSKLPKRSFPSHDTKIAVVGTSHCKYLFEAFDGWCKRTPGVCSWSGARVMDLIREVDHLPRTIEVIIFDAGTNDLVDTDPAMVLHYFKFLVKLTVGLRPQTKKVFATLVPLRTVNRRLRVPNTDMVGRFNHRARIFNDLLLQESRASGAFETINHCVKPDMLAADGLHFNRRGIQTIARQLNCWVLGRFSDDR